MATSAGDLTLLDHPLAQRLLSSTEPAQLAYLARRYTADRPDLVSLGWRGHRPHITTAGT
jgi:hypothetical protein